MARRNAPPLQLRMLGLMVVLALVGTLLVGRLGQLQLTDDPPAGAPLTSGPGTARVALPALRGRILDRDGVPIVDHEVRTDVTVDRRVLADADDGGRSLVRRLARTLDRPFDRLWGRTTLCGAPGAAEPPLCWAGSALVPVPVVEGVDPALAVSLTERRELFPGVEVTTRPVRSYPWVDRGGSAPQTVGYLTRASAETVAASEGRVSDVDLVGAAGLEQQYDDRLRGRAGERVVRVDARGVPVEEVSVTEPVPGDDLVTTLDIGVQRAGERALEAGLREARGRGLPADAGGVVVLDLRDGGVVASASAPTYDPSVWSDGVGQREYRRLTTGDASPLIDRVTAVAQPPASTFKAVTLPGAVAAGTDLDRPVACTSSHRIGDRVFGNFESRAYGTISWRTAMVVSCDTVFYRVAEQVWKEHGGLAARDDQGDPLIQTARDLGLGSTTGIDLPGESAGRIPGREWKRDYWEATKDETCRRAREGYPDVDSTARADYLRALARESCRNGYQFRPGDEANLSIGQGDVTATLLQMSRVYGALALEGRDPQPHLAQAFVRPDGTRDDLPTPKGGSVTFPGESGDLLRDSLRGVVTTGTAAPAFRGATLQGWPVAGKTGTAEVYGEEDTSWFVSWAPSSKPRYVVGVVVDQGGTGGSTAAGIAREVHEHLARED